MGKTNQPLVIAVSSELADLPEVQALRDKGHQVDVISLAAPPGVHGDSVVGYDIVLGPNCWRMTPQLVKYLELALKGARATKRSTKDVNGKKSPGLSTSTR